jgi:hypothetical protein
VLATVREWKNEEGWGILSAEKSLQVEIEVEGSLPPVEGCRFAASAVRPIP